MKIILNWISWLIVPLPATLWWFDKMRKNHIAARSWADRVAVVIIAMIFITMTGLTLITFCGIAQGINMFGIP